jgi:transaldolase
MSTLQKLSEAGQSPWLDFVSREFLDKKGLQKLVKEDGLGGVTSNPSIFEKAMGQGSDYDESHQAFLDKNPNAEVVDVYEHLAIASVASFFVSRIDAQVDKQLDDKIAKANDPSEKARLKDLKGKVAIANAKLAYQEYLKLFAGPRWEKLARPKAQNRSACSGPPPA